MKKIISLCLALCLTISLAAFPCYAGEAVSNGRGFVYVSNNGNDNATGSFDDPVATLHGAQAKVRNMKAEGKYPGGITVFVRGGNYSMAKPVVLTAEDTGTEDCPITWRNYENETVTLTAGINVYGTDFKKVTDEKILNRIVEKSARNSVYSLDLRKYGINDPGEPYLFGAYSYNSVTEIGLITKPEAPAMEVFFNGEPMTNARYPNEGYMTVARVVEPGWNYDDPEALPQGTPFKIAVEDDRLKYWTEAPQDSIMMFGYWRWEWADQTIPLHEIDVKNKYITSKWHSVFSVQPEKPFYVTNLLEEMDRPGEYYVDRDNATLYINPPSDIKNAELTMTVMEDAVIQIDGANHLTFKGIDVKGARNSAYIVKSGSYNKVVDCEISYTASFGAIFYGDHNGIRDSYIHDVDGGVRLYDGDIGELIPAENYCVNNHIETFARLTKTYKAAIAIDGVGNIATHNEIHDSPHQAIAYGGQLNKIMYNDIYDVLQATDDAGAIYGGLSWVSRGHEIKYNYIHDVINTGSGNAGGVYAVYGDGGQCELYICGNVFENFDGGAVLVNGGWDNIVLNNYFINTDHGVDVSAIMSGTDMKGFYTHHYPRMEAIQDEIDSSDAWQRVFPTFYAMMAVPDVEKAKPTNNVVANNIAYKTSLAKARSYSNADVRNNLELVSDPGFYDLKNRDYNLKADSPIFEQIPGFKAVPFTRMGRLDELAYGRVQNAVVMSVGSPKGMVKGELTAIDENASVAPFIDGDRTYIPLRFLAESLGATVSFSETDGVIGISDASVNLELKLGSQDAKKDGVAVTLDKAPLVIEGRTMVPLRQVSELLDRQVFWHDSGFIAISDDATLFESEEGSDDDIIEFLLEKVKVY